MTFEQELVLTIVDKALIGALVGLGAFVLNRRLERFKSTQALSNEYARQRLERIADLWEVLHAWEAEVVELSSVFRRAIGHHIGDGPPVLDRYADTFTELQQRRQEVKRRIERAQFWLGDGLHDRFLRYYQAILDHLGNMSGDRLEPAVSDAAMAHLEQALAAVRQSIFDYMEPPLAAMKDAMWRQRKSRGNS